MSMANVRGGTACNIPSFVAHSAHPSPIGHTGGLFSSVQWAHWAALGGRVAVSYAASEWFSILYLGEDTLVEVHSLYTLPVVR